MHGQKQGYINALQKQDYTNPYPCDDNSFLPLFLHPETELKMAFFLKKNLIFSIELFQLSCKIAMEGGGGCLRYVFSTLVL